ncbi:MAG: hypothetical protein MUF15_15015, partial [Acidobacteria bacterium]|nr:hypothetical protein [Acidobacteriota bacterium]
IKTILIRLLLLNIFFALLLLVNFIGAGFLSVTFSKEEITCFIWYSVCALIILSTSFLVGLLINSICKYKKNAIQILMIIWFIFIFVLPEINKVYRSIKSSSLPSEEKLDIEKLSTLLDSEYNIKLTISNHLSKRKLNSQQDIQEYQKLLKSLLQNYIHNGYAQNKNKENNFLQEVKRDMEIFSYLNIIFPVDFLSHISAEISGEGFSAYIHFFEYIVKLKDNFLQFYSQKRAETISTPNQSGVESFIQNTDNVYQTKSRLPENFIWGVMIMIIYFIILLFLIHFSQKKVKKIPGVIGVTETYKPGFILFLLVNKKKQDEVVNSFKQGKRKFLHRTSHLILNKEVTGRNFVNYACHEKEIERHKVIANIKSLGITEDDLNVKISKLTEEKKRKIICALIFAEEGDCFVINDFIKGASYEFEKQFLELVSQEVNLKRKIIYIGTEIYTPGSSLIKWDIKIDTYQRFHLDPKKISLR